MCPLFRVLFNRHSTAYCMLYDQKKFIKQLTCYTVVRTRHGTTPENRLTDLSLPIHITFCPSFTLTVITVHQERIIINGTES